ncbi:hypothetical protein LCGC14_0224770 [marine sediment metagenome]|uniref:Uncharacterized protein n=1 Tax=marine sediment metagenome TaxID=412755 RepID=A0A0F9XG80_9ZZZZ|nr:hypothetical protein [bacterium]
MNDIELMKIMEELDKMYHYANRLIPKCKIHSLGHKKEILKELIENTIKKSESEYKKKVQDALNKCFKHTMKYKGIIQIFPLAIYHIYGKGVEELYKTLGIKNE